MFKNIVRSTVQNIPRTIVGNRSYGLYGPANYKPLSLDDLPVPHGSWQEDYDRRQKKYNMHLIGGILFTVITLITAKSSGLVYLNWNPPTPKPEN